MFIDTLIKRFTIGEPDNFKFNNKCSVDCVHLTFGKTSVRQTEVRTISFSIYTIGSLNTDLFKAISFLVSYENDVNLSKCKQIIYNYYMLLNEELIPASWKHTPNSFMSQIPYVVDV